jgi:cell division protein FtsQ
VRAIRRATSRREPIVERVSAGKRSGPLPRRALKAERSWWRDRWTRGEGLRGWGLAATAVLFGATGAYGLALGGALPGPRALAATAMDETTRRLGFGLAEVEVTGLVRMTPSEVVERMELTAATSLIGFDAEGARRRLLAVPWIRSATVRVYLPGKIAVSLVERDPFAIWQREGQVLLVDREGRVIGPYDDPRFSHLPLVVGRGAERRVGEVGALLDPHPAIRSRVRAAVLVADRRWTLKLGDGVDVMLPEIDPAGAVALLARLDRDTGLLNRDIAAVDLRLPSRVVVRLTDRAAGIRADQLRTRSRMPQRAERLVHAGRPT